MAADTAIRTASPDTDSSSSSLTGTAPSPNHAAAGAGWESAPGAAAAANTPHGTAKTSTHASVTLARRTHITRTNPFRPSRAGLYQ